MEVLLRCRAIDSDTDYLNLAKSYTNRIHKEALAYRPWPFRNKAGTLVTEPPYTTGTVSVTQNSGAITGSGTAFTSSHVGYYLKIGSAPDLHLVTAYSSATAITVSPVVAIATASAQSFKLFRLGYALPSDFRLPNEPSNFETRPPMEFIGAREFRRKMSGPIFGTPEMWTLLWTLSATAAPVPTMGFFPFANTYTRIHFDYQTTITDLVGDSDPLQIPDEYRSLVVEGAMALMYRDVFDDPVRAKICQGEHDKLRNQMANDYGFFDDPVQMVPHNYRGSPRTVDEAAIARTVWENR